MKIEIRREKPGINRSQNETPKQLGVLYRQRIIFNRIVENRIQNLKEPTSSSSIGEPRRRHYSARAPEEIIITYNSSLEHGTPNRGRPSGGLDKRSTGK